MMDISSEQISTDVSRESAAEAPSTSTQRSANLEEKTDTALPSKQSTTSCSALTKEKSFLVTPLKKHIDNQKKELIRHHLLFQNNGLRIGIERVPLHPHR